MHAANKNDSFAALHILLLRLACLFMRGGSIWGQPHSENLCGVVVRIARSRRGLEKKRGAGLRGAILTDTEALGGKLDEVIKALPEKVGLRRGDVGFSVPDLDVLQIQQKRVRRNIRHHGAQLMTHSRACWRRDSEPPCNQKQWRLMMRAEDFSHAPPSVKRWVVVLPLPHHLCFTLSGAFSYSVWWIADNGIQPLHHRPRTPHHIA